MNTKLATRGKPSLTPFSRPLPAPNSTVSMKIPQKTPKAVRLVRTLCWLRVLKISCHLSTSMSMTVRRLLRAHGFGRCDLRGPQGRRQSREQAHPQQQEYGGDRDLEIDLGIQKIGQF